MRARKSPFLILSFEAQFWCSFERYPEENVASMYGLPALDAWGQNFPNFEYTSN